MFGKINEPFEFPRCILMKSYLAGSRMTGVNGILRYAQNDES